MLSHFMLQDLNKLEFACYLAGGDKIYINHETMNFVRFYENASFIL